MGSITLDTHLNHVLKPHIAQDLATEFGYTTVRDLIVHYPRRYEPRGALTNIESLPLKEHVTLMAEVVHVTTRSMGRRPGKITEAIISDGHGQVTLTWFNQAWRAKYIRPGMRGLFAGKITEYRGKYQLAHPEYYFFDADEQGEDVEQQITNIDRLRAKVVPVYPATAKVASWVLLDAIETVLAQLDGIEDPLPGSVRKEAYEFFQDELAGTQSAYESRILPLHTALTRMHKPDSLEEQREAKYSLLFREAFELQLGLLDRKRHSIDQTTHEWPVHPDGMLAAFDESLPFTLTEDQHMVGRTIQRELGRGTPMHRLLQGEVASGKTLVALRAMLQIADERGQSALLAPTEVLASQHLRSITELLGDTLTRELKPTLLTGQMPAAERKRALLDIVSGEARIVIGTHALMSETTTFNLLGLVIIDEQHRFGVRQRDALRKKARLTPHLLVMTATPIPRTIALTTFGDLDVSVITQLPPGRLGINSHVVALAEHPAWKQRMWSRAAEEIRAGRQAYVVCPAISPEEDPQGVDAPPADEDPGSAPRKPLENVTETLEEVRGHPELGEARTAVLTGEMGPEDKDTVMRAFAAGDIDLLVATTVIEVGVNVPNATVMIVRDADRFGISQLHQLRGRVGRGSYAGLCLLETTMPQGSQARARVEAVAASNDGFALADYDLEQRREGDLLGDQQSGTTSTLNLLRVTQHGALIQRARLSAETLLANHPDLRSFPLLEDLIRRGRGEHLDQLGKS